VAGTNGEYNVWTLQLPGVELLGKSELYFRGKGSANANFAFKLIADGVEGPIPRQTRVGRMPVQQGTYRIDLSDVVEAYAGRLNLRAIQLVALSGDGDPAEILLEDIGFNSENGATSYRESFRPKRSVFQAAFALRPAPRVVKVSRRRYSAQYSVEVECSEKIGYLIIAEPWYPNWRVTIDGAPVETFRAYTALLGIQLPGPGRHIVEVRQGMIWPQIIGGVISLLALLWILFFYFGILPRSRRRQHE
jgi:hypothetical protein